MRRTVPIAVATVALAGALAWGCRRPDPDVAAEVAVKLAADPQLGDLEFRVEATDGVVRVTGSTNSIDDERRAVLVAEKVPGVRDVVTDMWLSDSLLCEAVERRLAGDPELRGLALTVEAQRGVVRLTSDATTKAQRQRINDLVSHVDGVRRVEDHMR